MIRLYRRKALAHFGHAPIRCTNHGRDRRNPNLLAQLETKAESSHHVFPLTRVALIAAHLSQKENSSVSNSMTGPGTSFRLLLEPLLQVDYQINKPHHGRPISLMMRLFIACASV